MKKARAIMASTTSPDGEEPIIDMAELGAQLKARRAQLGQDGEMPRNVGTGRTAAKRALLAAIKGAGGKW